MEIQSQDRFTVLVVDDTPANLSLLVGILKPEYRVKMANTGERALELAFQAPPDLVLCDIMMPGMNGYEVCRRLSANPATARVPVIFVSAAVNVEDEQTGFEAGAVDYIHKPLSPPIVLARVKTHLKLKHLRDLMEHKSADLQQEVNRRVKQVVQLQTASIHVMVSLAEFRDEETGNHIRRTQAYVRLLGLWLPRNGHYVSELNETTVDQIAQAAPLHDIGKIAIPDDILLKPGRHTPDEWAVMQTHAMRGFDILQRARASLGEDNPLLIYAAEITRHHHERWDASGYPDGLSGQAIPLSARLMAVADVYDALRSTRPYKKPFSHQAACELIEQGRGSHFDPVLIDAFQALETEIAEIALKLADDLGAAD